MATLSARGESPPLGNSAGSASPAGHVPASPGPYAGADQAVGPAAVLQLSHGHFMITLSVVTTFPPSAVLPTVYSLLPGSQLAIDHIDIQADEKSHKMRVQVVGVNPVNNPHAVSTLASRMKALQPGASVTTHKELSQLSVDPDSIPVVSSLLMSSQSRALLDAHLPYYRLHSHPAFLPSLLIYMTTNKCEHVINIMRNFMADPIAGGAVRPPRPNGMEVKGDEIPSSGAAEGSAKPSSAQTTPEKPPKPDASGSGAPLPPHRVVASSSRSPHFKPKNIGTPASSIGLPPAPHTLGGGQSAASATAVAPQHGGAPSATTSLPAGPAMESALSAAAPPPSADSGASVFSANLATAAAHNATTHHGAAASPIAGGSHGIASFPDVTSVAQTVPIRIDHKWWSSQRAELLSLMARHSMVSDSLYVYSLPQVKTNMDLLRSNLTAIDQFYFAVKANCNEEVLRCIESGGFGFECVSLQELKFVRELFPNLPKERLLFTPNFASKIEFEEAFFLVDQVNLDNLWPLVHWGEVFRNKRVLLRMDPGQVGEGYNDKVRTAGAKSKFGISVEQLNDSVDMLRKLSVKVVGLHVHKGSGIHDAGSWGRTASFLGRFLDLFPSIEVLDLGGGLGVEYKSTDPPLELAAMNEAIAAFRKSLPEGRGEKLKLWLEPGRFVVASAGVLLSPVTQLKSKPGRSFVGLATGMNSLLRPALYDSHHDIINLSKLPEPGMVRKEGSGKEFLNSLDGDSHMLVDVVGPICETGDVLGKARSLPTSTAEGDVILIDTAGAYGHVMSSLYNLRPPAKEITIQ